MPKKAKQAVCRRCRGPLPAAARRCSRCGAQAFVAQPLDPAAAERNEKDRLVRLYDLSEIQTEILLAADGREILVLGNQQREEGEVKAGDHRFEGNEAVAAVAGLAGLKLISPEGEDSFRLTAAGTKLAQTLDSRPAVEA